MNFANLLENIKNGIDYNAFCALRNDFIENQFHAAYDSLRPCKSTAEKAVKRYIAAAPYKDAKTKGVYTDGKTALILSDDKPEAENEKIQKIEIAEKIIETWKNRKPSHCYFLDSIALYKAYKKQEKAEYLLHLDGNYYNAAFISEMIECIAIKRDEYISAEICENGALLVKGKGGAALILPVKRTGCHISRNINSQDFFKYLSDIEDKYIEEIKKSA